MKPKFVISCEQTDIMNLIGKKGIRGHNVLYVVIGLLAFAASQAAGSPEEEVSFLRLKLQLLRNQYINMCNHYSSLASNCSAPAVKCSQCPDEWLTVGDQCFQLSTDRDDFVNSSNKCAEIGAHLAILTTKEQHQAVEQEGRRLGGIYTYYWIGLNDIELEGDWRWVDNSTLKNSFWDLTQSEPNNHQADGPEGEDCAVVYSYDQLWYDVPCSFLYPRICQMDAIPLE